MKAYNEYMSRYQDILGDVEKSKKAAQIETEVGKKMLDPKWRQSATQQDVDIAHKMGLPIYDSNHYKDGHTTPFSEEDLSFNAPQFDSKQQDAFLKDIQQGYKPQREQGDIQIDKKTGTKIINYTDKFNKDQLMGMGERARNLVKSNPSAQSFFENIQHNPQEYEVLNSVYKPIYGKDILTPEDAAVAFALHDKVSQTKQGRDVRQWTDPNAALSREITYYNYKDNKQKEDQSKNDAINWISQGPQVLKSGNKEAINNYLSYLGTGGAKGINVTGIEHQPIPQQNGLWSPNSNFDEIPTVNYTKKEFVPDPDGSGKGTYQDVPHSIQFDPHDPNLNVKLQKAFVTLKGNDKKVIQKDFTKQQAEESKKPVKQENTKDPLGILSLLKK
jgi:hypothetical protein